MSYKSNLAIMTNDQLLHALEQYFGKPVVLDLEDMGMLDAVRNDYLPGMDDRGFYIAGGEHYNSFGEFITFDYIPPSIVHKDLVEGGAHWTHRDFSPAIATIFAEQNRSLYVDGLMHEDILL